MPEEKVKKLKRFINNISEMSNCYSYFINITCKIKCIVFPGSCYSKFHGSSNVVSNRNSNRLKPGKFDSLFLPADCTSTIQQNRCTICGYSKIVKYKCS